MVEEEKDTVQRSLERLSQAGYELLSAHDGHNGFQMAKDKVPDLIIINAVVPGMSGYELCKAIKLDENTKLIPIIVITEKHRMEDAFMFLGIKDFLSKPVCMDELEIIVRKKLNLSQYMHLQKSKISIYGRPEVLICSQQLLKSETHWSVHCSHESEAFVANAVKTAPDVILMDLLMHGAPIDEMIKKLKSAPELKNTTILTYYASASVSQDSITTQAQMIEVQYMRESAQEAGAKEYLGAFNPVTFLNLIDVYRKDALAV